MSKKITLDVNKFQRLQLSRVCTKEQWDINSVKMMDELALQLTVELIKQRLIKYKAFSYVTGIKIIAEMVIVKPDERK